MMYFNVYEEFATLLPTISVSLESEFWVEIDWLNFGVGWRSGDGGEGDYDSIERKIA
jgi:hypothetical protein